MSFQNTQLAIWPPQGNASQLTSTAHWQMPWVGPNPNPSLRRAYLDNFFSRMPGSPCPAAFHSEKESTRVQCEEAVTRDLLNFGWRDCQEGYFQWLVDWKMWDIYAQKTASAAFPWPNQVVIDSGDQYSASFRWWAGKIREEDGRDNVSQASTVKDENGDVGQLHQQQLEAPAATTLQDPRNRPATSANKTTEEIEMLQTRLAEVENKLLTDKMKHVEKVAGLEAQLADSLASHERLRDDTEARSEGYSQRIYGIEQEKKDIADQLSRAIGCHDEVRRLYEDVAARADVLEAQLSKATGDGAEQKRIICDQGEKLKAVQENLNESHRIRLELKAHLAAAQTQESLINAIQSRFNDGLQTRMDSDSSKRKVDNLELDLEKTRNELRAIKRLEQDALDDAHKYKSSEMKALATLEQSQNDLESSRRMVAQLRGDNECLGVRIKTMEARIDQYKTQQETLSKTLEIERALLVSLRRSTESCASEEVGRKRPRLMPTTEKPKTCFNSIPEVTWRPPSFCVLTTRLDDLTQVKKLINFVKDTYYSKFMEFLTYGSLDTWFSIEEVRSHGSKANKACSLRADGCTAQCKTYHAMVTMEGKLRKISFQWY